MGRVSVVMDTTGYLPRDLIDRKRIKLVSLYCSFGNGDTFREIDLEDYAPFYERLQTDEVLPTTSPPLVEDFVAAYEPLLTRGGSVVSVHISSGVSETCSAARKAAEMLAASGKGGERIQVIDSASAAGQLGALGLVAVRAAEAGKDLAGVAELVRQARMEARSWGLVDTLEFFKRGGRIGTAAALIGSTLKIKPIITLESEIKAVERVRTRERGLDRLVEYGRQLHAAGANAWFVQHAAAPDDAHALAKRLQEIFWRPPEFVSEWGPVLGTHAGPGLVGFGGLPPRFLE
jgi:DegV family protein with EDD domain